MRHPAVQLLVLVLGALVGPFCSGLLAGEAPEQPGANYNPAASFSSYSTYAWLARPPGAAGSIEERNPTGHRAIRSAVERQLESKGLSLTRATPDLYVTYHAIRKTGGVDLSGAGYAAPGRFGDPSTIEPTIEGTLVIDLVDGKSRELVWRGWMTAVLTRTELLDKEDAERKIDEVVGRILEAFPPQPHGQ